LPLPKSGRWREVLNSDAEIYWGTGKGNNGFIEAENGPSHGKPASAKITLPPLATLYFVSE
jgi:1,4-alpha-glucan branching enzyme